MSSRWPSHLIRDATPRFAGKFDAMLRSLVGLMRPSHQEQRIGELGQRLDNPVRALGLGLHADREPNPGPVSNAELTRVPPGALRSLRYSGLRREADRVGGSRYMRCDSVRHALQYFSNWLWLSRMVLVFWLGPNKSFSISSKVR